MGAGSAEAPPTLISAEFWASAELFRLPMFKNRDLSSRIVLLEWHEILIGAEVFAGESEALGKRHARFLSRLLTNLQEEAPFREEAHVLEVGT